MLRLAAALEQGSEHPLAAAIVAGARERAVPTARRPTGFESHHRQGRRRDASTGRASRSATSRLMRGPAASTSTQLAAARRRAAARGPDRDVRGRRRPRRPGSSASPIPIKDSHRGSDRDAASRGTAHRHADRRQPRRPPKPSRGSSASTTSGPTCCPRRKREVVRQLQREGPDRGDGGRRHQRRARARRGGRRHRDGHRHRRRDRERRHHAASRAICAASPAPAA